MTYLLDTHTLIWALTELQKLSVIVRSLLEDNTNDVAVSAISFWEISLKASIRKLTLQGLSPDDFLKAALETGFRLIDLDGETASSYHRLTATYHRDPFDRMLIWQAIQHGYSLVSKDENVQKYQSEGLHFVW